MKRIQPTHGRAHGPRWTSTAVRWGRLVGLPILMLWAAVVFAVVALPAFAGPPYPTQAEILNMRRQLREQQQQRWQMDRQSQWVRLEVATSVPAAARDVETAHLCLDHSWQDLRVVWLIRPSGTHAGDTIRIPHTGPGRQWVQLQPGRWSIGLVIAETVSAHPRLEITLPTREFEAGQAHTARLEPYVTDEVKRRLEAAENG